MYFSRKQIKMLFFYVYHMISTGFGFFDDIHAFCSGFFILQCFPCFVNNYKKRNNIKSLLLHIAKINTYFQMLAAHVLHHLDFYQDEQELTSIK